MSVVYKIETHHGERDYDKYCFTSRKKCENIINQWAEEQYGKPVYSEDSEEVKQVNEYWAGDMSYEELKKLQKKKHDDAMASALYYDYVDLYWIKELKIIEDEN